MEVDITERDKTITQMKEDLMAKQTELDAAQVVHKEMANKIDSLMADNTELRRSLLIF